MVPYYMVLRDLKLTSSFWLYVIPGLYSFYNFVLLRSNFATIPGELRESAQLDGANDWTILSRIYLPLSKPILATLTLFTGVGKWNDWFTGAYYQSKSSSVSGSYRITEDFKRSNCFQPDQGRTGNTAW